MSAYEKVLLARAKDRPTGISYIENIFEDFIELHGDRRFADDPAIVGGIATLHGRPVTVIAMEKGKDMRVTNKIVITIFKISNFYTSCA